MFLHLLNPMAMEKTMKNLHFTDFTDDCPIQPSCALRIFQPATVDPRPKPCDGSCDVTDLQGQKNEFFEKPSES